MKGMHYAKPKMKGMSLPLETVVLLILAAIVLAALLGFFLNFFNPGQSTAEIYNKRTELCRQIVTADPRCIAAGSVDVLAGQLLSTVCGRPSDAPICGRKDMSKQDCIDACCGHFLCP